eukprot:364097-Chlamydomonas_euryale.AAC.3
MPNAVTLNAVTPNAVMPNAVTPNAVAPSLVTPNAGGAARSCTIRKRGQAGRAGSTSARRSIPRRLAHERSNPKPFDFLAHAQRILAHEQPILAHAQRILAHEQPILAHAQRILAHEQCILAHEQRIIAHEQRIIAHEQRILAHAQPILAHAQRILADEQPILAHAQHILAHEQCILAHEQRIIAHEQRIIAHEQRILAHAQRILAHAQRILAHEQRILAHAQRILAHAQRILAHEQPILAHEQPILAHEQRILAHVAAALPEQHSTLSDRLHTPPALSCMQAKRIYDPNFIAANQSHRADNVLSGSKAEQLAAVRQQIREFKANNGVDKVWEAGVWNARVERGCVQCSWPVGRRFSLISTCNVHVFISAHPSIHQVVILWTANTERMTQLVDGLNDTEENLLSSIARGEAEVNPSVPTEPGVAFVA